LGSETSVFSPKESVQVFGENLLDGHLVVFAGERGKQREFGQAGVALESFVVVAERGESHRQQTEFVHRRLLRAQQRVEVGDGGGRV